MRCSRGLTVLVAGVAAIGATITLGACGGDDGGGAESSGTGPAASPVTSPATRPVTSSTTTPATTALATTTTVTSVPLVTTSTAAPAGNLPGGTTTDQACTDPAALLEPVGVGLDELPEMTLDLRGVTGLEDPDWTVESFFMDNARFGWEWPEGCNEIADLGRISGHMRSATDYSVMNGTAATPQVLSVVHLFRDDASAEAYVQWVPDATPWPCIYCTGGTQRAVPAESVSVEPLPGAGRGAALVNMTSPVGDRVVGLAREGAMVAEVVAVGPPGHVPEVDVPALTVAAHQRIIDTVDTGATGAARTRIDATQLVSAPLPLAAWGEDAAGYEWDLQYAGGRDNDEWLLMSSDPATATTAIVEDGRLVSFQGNYVGEGPTWIATGLTTFATEAGAQHWFRSSVRQRLETPEAERFTVPGVEGAVGIVHITDPGSPDPELTTEVFLLRGAAIARAYVVEHGVHVLDGSADNRAQVIAATQAWVPRLDAVLGA